jgi:hypothetical protein
MTTHQIPSTDYLTSTRGMKRYGTKAGFLLMPALSIYNTVFLSIHKPFYHASIIYRTFATCFSRSSFFR